MPGSLDLVRVLAFLGQPADAVAVATCLDVEVDRVAAGLVDLAGQGALVDEGDGAFGPADPTLAGRLLDEVSPADRVRWVDALERAGLAHRAARALETLDPTPAHLERQAGLLHFLGLDEEAADRVRRIAADDDDLPPGATRTLGAVARGQRRWKRSEALLDRAVPSLTSAGQPGLALHAAIERAELAWDQRDRQQATERLELARERAAEGGSDRRHLARISRLSAELALDRNDREDADLSSRVAVESIEDRPETCDEREFAWLARHTRARLHLAAGRHAEAITELEAAAALIDDVAHHLPDDVRRAFLSRTSVQAILLDLPFARGGLGRTRDHAATGRVRDELLEERNALIRFQAVAQAFAAERDLDRLLQLVIDAGIEATGAERGFVATREDDRLRFWVARNIDREEVKKPRFKVSQSIVRRVLESGQAVLTDEARLDPRFFDARSVQEMRLQSILCLPLVLEGRTIGVLYLDHRYETGVFGRADFRFMEAVAIQASLALENARLVDALDRRQREVENRKAEVDELNRRLEELNESLRLRVDDRERELSTVRRELSHARARAGGGGDLIGESVAIRRVLGLIDRAAASDLPVLIEGESGTGKELVSRQIHDRSRRGSGPFVVENCGAIPETLVESVLFGHRKGAFTGADRDRKGLFEQAHGGTLFLDEIGEMPLESQKRLLRVLQEGEIRAVGSDEVLPVDVRIVAATHQRLLEMVEAGRFREDLYYRLHVLHVAVPPLRERPEDVGLLVEHFLGSLETPPKVESEVLDALGGYEWPGNVRELQNEVQRWSTLGRATIGVDDLSLRLRRTSARPTGRIGGWNGKTLREIERETIAEVLAETGGNKKRAAELLGLPRRTLYARIKKFELDE